MAPLDDRAAAPTAETVRRMVEPVMRPVTEAKGLPNGFYHDPGLFELERRRVFFDGWAGLAFAHDAPEPGDVKPIDFLGTPLLLARGRDGAVRVFENVCRHRGMILVDAPKKIEGALRCPYHSWCYGLDGRLVATPHVGGPGENAHPAIDRASLGLTEIRAHEWMGVVFVNLSGDAPDFETANAPLMARWREFDHPLYFSGADSAFELNLAANWKLCVENYCESYHLPWVHPGLNSYSRLEDHYNIVEYGAHSGQGTLVYRPSLSEDGARFPDFPGLSDKWDAGAEYVTAFPNVMLGVHRDHVFAILIEPHGPERSVERIGVFYASPDSVSDALAPLRESLAAMWKEVFLEDIFVVEGMQRGRRAEKFDGGRFSPVMDEPTHVFHDWAARRLAP